jgi:hypothetical protein
MIAMVEAAARTDSGRPLNRMLEIAHALAGERIDVVRAVDAILAKLGSGFLFHATVEEARSRALKDRTRFVAFAGGRQDAPAPKFGEAARPGAILAGSLAPRRV